MVERARSRDEILQLGLDAAKQCTMPHEGLERPAGSAAFRAACLDLNYHAGIAAARAGYTAEEVGDEDAELFRRGFTRYLGDNECFHTQ
ncbi:hypothetical protein [Streptomyces noursei]|uniref:hypothetical protein n=1 Tax=Streptomyces noursei TaxID=1971 RepID=UPI0023B7B32A|nr:hypothetical protein [Streptomyces noursei]